MGQWLKHVDQEGLARLRMPFDPLTGEYRVQDEKTIRVLLDRLIRRPWSGLCSGRVGARWPGNRTAGASSGSVSIGPAALLRSGRPG